LNSSIVSKLLRAIGVTPLARWCVVGMCFSLVALYASAFLLNAAMEIAVSGADDPRSNLLLYVFRSLPNVGNEASLASFVVVLSLVSGVGAMSTFVSVAIIGSRSKPVDRRGIADKSGQ